MKPSSTARDYNSVMGRQADILRTSAGIDYSEFRRGRLVFDYDALMGSTGYTLDRIAEIQASCKVGHTPFLELKSLTR